MSGDWEEIRKLAADLQRAQLSGALQKLSERNCIEIVNRLVEMGSLSIIFTTDGKEYVTPQQLQKEIGDELYVSGGRIGLAELSHTLCIDYSQVEAQAEVVASHDPGTYLVLGQLVSSSYLDKVAHEINEKLQLMGTVCLADAIKEFNLPADFLQEQLIGKRLGSVIEGFQDEHDPKVILTHSYVCRNRARIRGALNAITVPTQTSSILSKFGFEARLFFQLADQLIRDNKVRGCLGSGRSVYVPSIHSRAQNKWMEDFIAHNDYLDFDSLRRLGISDPSAACQRKFGSQVALLKTCCVSQSLVDQVEAALDSAIAADSWLDVAPLVSSSLTDRDVGELLLQIRQRSALLSGSTKTFCNTVVLTNHLIHRVKEPFSATISEKATQTVQSGLYAQTMKQMSGTDASKASLLTVSLQQQDKKEDRRKKATGGKMGGGTQGRETKTKSTKKKGGKKQQRQADSEDSSADQDEEEEGGSSVRKPPALQFMTQSELAQQLSQISIFADAPDGLFDQLARHLLPDLSKEYQAYLAHLYESSSSVSTQVKKKSLAEFQEKLNTLMDNLRLFEKALAQFNDADKAALERHLLKTLCSEVASHLLRQACLDFEVEVQLPSDVLSAEERLKVLGHLPKSAAQPLLVVHRALSADNSVANFLGALDTALPEAFGLALRKVDKKRDRQVLFNHRQSLIQQLDQGSDGAVVLHLASLILFQAQTGHMLHASGKFVPTIIAHLMRNMAQDDAAILSKCQSEVVQSLTADDSESATLQLEQLIPQVKELVKRHVSKSSKQ